MGNPPGPSFFSPSRSMAPYRSARPARTRTIRLRRNELVREQRQLFSSRNDSGLLCDSNAELRLPQGRAAAETSLPSLPWYMKLRCRPSYPCACPHDLILIITVIKPQGRTSQHCSGNLFSFNEHEVKGKRFNAAEWPILVTEFCLSQPRVCTQKLQA